MGAVFLNSNAAATKLLSFVFLLIAITAGACESQGITVWRSILYGSISGTVLSLLLSFEQSGARFSNTTMVAVGDASYSIYLSHSAFIAFLRRIGDSFQTREVNSIAALGALVLALVGSSFLGWIIFNQFERRVMTWRNTFVRRSLPSNDSTLLQG